MPSDAYTALLNLEFSQNSVILFLLPRLQKDLKLPKTLQYHSLKMTGLSYIS